MTQSKLLAVASLFTAGLLATSRHAQQLPATGAPAANAPGGQGGAQGGGQAGSYDPTTGAPESGEPQPVAFVTSVEVLRSDRAGGLDVIRVRGLTTSQNWGQPHLIPITQGESRDGMLDLIFMSVAPPNAQLLGAFMPVEAILPVESGHPYKGVRVRGGYNALSLKQIPGYAEVAAPKQDCSKCLGKFFVAKGGTAPAGATADNTVKEEDLPYTLRVIKPTDGIPNYAFDPNRLTLVLSEDGRIVDAAWD